MRGFDSKWRDVPHYIIGITKDNWEDFRRDYTLIDNSATWKQILLQTGSHS
jgi:hypothetical protein